LAEYVKGLDRGVVTVAGLPFTLCSVLIVQSRRTRKWTCEKKEKGGEGNYGPPHFLVPPWENRNDVVRDLVPKRPKTPREWAMTV
jgi:hypothetical protein